MIDSSIYSKILSEELFLVVKKIQNRERISDEEALILYNNAPLSLLGILANDIRERMHALSISLQAMVKYESLSKATSSLL